MLANDSFDPTIGFNLRCPAELYCPVPVLVVSEIVPRAVMGIYAFNSLFFEMYPKLSYS